MYITQMPHSPVLSRRSVPSPCRKRRTSRASGRLGGELVEYGVAVRGADLLYLLPLYPLLDARLLVCEALHGLLVGLWFASLRLRPALAAFELEVLYELLAGTGVNAPLRF
jgi:hypothetical protein